MLLIVIHLLFKLNFFKIIFIIMISTITQANLFFDTPFLTQIMAEEDYFLFIYFITKSYDDFIFNNLAITSFMCL